MLPGVASVSRNPGCFSSTDILWLQQLCKHQLLQNCFQFWAQGSSSGCVPEPQSNQKSSQKNLTLLSSKASDFLPTHWIVNAQRTNGWGFFTLLIMQIRIHKTFLGLWSFIKDSNDLIYFKCWKDTLSCGGFSIASMASWLAPAKGMEWQEHFSGITLALSSLVTLVKHVLCGACCQGLGFRNSSLPLP